MAILLRKPLRIENLEDRCTPALTIQFDYRYDTGNFFADPSRRAILEQVGRDLAEPILSTPLAITPTGSNRWSALFENPSTGQQVSLANLAVPEGTVIVFVGSRDLTGSEAGIGGNGGYTAGGNTAWFGQIANRGQSGFTLWGGSISFDSNQPWYFGGNSQGLTTDRTDFYTVATHELGHVLGFGTNSFFERDIAGQTFTGPTATRVNGGTPPRLSADLDHFAQGTLSGSRPVSMEPYLLAGQRYGFTPLDYAALADIGWSIAPTVFATTIPPNVPPANVPLPTGTATLGDPFALSGGVDGRVSFYQGKADSTLASAGAALQPFPDQTGAVRTVRADFNGDGTTDLACVTTAGGPSRLRVIDGRTGADLLAPIAVFGNAFTGGLFVASADFDRDGKADVVISPDNGGGGRISIFNIATGGQRVGDFFGIDDVNFRGGARIAAADLNGDGVPDLVVGAGIGGGPRIALFDGTTLTQDKPRKFVGDFFAFGGAEATALRNGVYVTSGDLNGDGKADLIFGAGPGGGPRVFALNIATVLAGNLDAARATPLSDFFAYDSSDRGGVSVAVKDVNGDGKADVLVGSLSSHAVIIYSGSSVWSGGNPGNGIVQFPDSLRGPLHGVYVG